MRTQLQLMTAAMVALASSGGLAYWSFQAWLVHQLPVSPVWAMVATGSWLASLRWMIARDVRSGSPPPGHAIWAAAVVPLSAAAALLVWRDRPFGLERADAAVIPTGFAWMLSCFRLTIAISRSWAIRSEANVRSLGMWQTLVFGLWSVVVLGVVGYGAGVDWRHRMPLEHTVDVVSAMPLVAIVGLLPKWLRMVVEGLRGRGLPLATPSGSNVPAPREAWTVAWGCTAVALLGAGMEWLLARR